MNLMNNLNFCGGPLWGAQNLKLPVPDQGIRWSLGRALAAAVLYMRRSLIHSCSWGLFWLPEVLVRQEFGTRVVSVGVQFQRTRVQACRNGCMGMYSARAYLVAMLHHKCISSFRPWAWSSSCCGTCGQQKVGSLGYKGC